MLLIAKVFTTKYKVVLAGFLVGILLLSISVTSLASIGVGVGTGIIDVSDKLRAGGIYNLPIVVVHNTGTETATYEMALTLNQTQDELKPNPAWFSFSPDQFQLEPGQSRNVTPTIHLPVRVEPGKYYGYLEARPIEADAEGGTTRVGVAAAAILKFEAEASNLFWAILYRLRSLYHQAEPWSHVTVGVVVATIAALIFRRYLRINIKITRTKKSRKEKQSK